MIVVDVKIRGRKVGEIRKPDSSRRWRWSAYIKGRFSFRDHYAFVGIFAKQDAIRIVKEWFQP
jgi:hypothetical protein